MIPNHWEIAVGDTFRTRDKGWLTVLADRGNGYYTIRHSDMQPVCQTWADVRFDGAECYHAYHGRYQWWDLQTREDSE